MAALLVVLAFLVGAVACDDATSGGIPPTTGILIRAEALTSGKGCGVGPTQVFKYVVVVFRYDGQGNPQSRSSYTTFQAENIFDCWADGEFVSLPDNVGNQIYRLEVYAFNKASYDANRAAIEGAVKSTNDTDPSNDQATSEPFQKAIPTWTTECTATQSNEVETLAQCDPLSPGLGGVGDGTTQPTQIELATDIFTLPDGRRAVCLPGAATDAGTGDAQTDAGTVSDAGSDDSGDSGDAGDAETGASEPADAGDAGNPVPADAGGPPVTFATVRVRPRIGGNIVKDPVDVPCGGAFLVDVGAEPASYTIDVGLIDGSGAPVGQLACTTTTTTGVKNVAVCPRP